MICRKMFDIVCLETPQTAVATSGTVVWRRIGTSHFRVLNKISFECVGV
jgi:hypothetical protein